MGMWFDDLSPEITNRVRESVDHVSIFDNKFLESVETLDLSYLDLREVPGFIKGLVNLKSVNLGNNKISGNVYGKQFPDSLLHLDLSNNLIENFVIEGMTANAMKTLIILDLSANLLSEPIKDIIKLSKLSELHLLKNKFTKIDEEFRIPVNLRMLDLSSNMIESVSVRKTGGLTRCKNVYLDRNQLSEIPDDIFRGRLTHLSLTDNPLHNVDGLIGRGKVRVLV